MRQKAAPRSEKRTIAPAKASESCPDATSSRLGEKVTSGNRGFCSRIYSLHLAAYFSSFLLFRTARCLPRSPGVRVGCAHGL
jgi:hypothetical protein